MAVASSCVAPAVVLECREGEEPEQGSLSEPAVQAPVARWCQVERDGSWQMHGGVVGLYPNGQPKVRGAFSEGLPHGLFTYWSPEGSLSALGQYQNGQRVGPWVELHRWEDGQLAIAQAEFAADKINGRVWEWWSDGRPRSRGHYVDGEANGESELFYDSGRVRSRATFADDKLNGDFTHFHPGGGVKMVGHAVDGWATGSARGFYPKGELRWTGSSGASGRHGVWTYHARDGSVSKIETYEEGELIELIDFSSDSAGSKVVCPSGGRLKRDPSGDPSDSLKIFCESPGADGGWAPDSWYSEWWLDGEKTRTGAYVDGQLIVGGE